MRAILMASAIAVSFASAATADDGVMTTRFGNTTISKDAAGSETHLYYAADGTFRGKQGARDFKGTWKLDGATVCLTADPPIPDTPNPVCVPISAHKVGDTWTAGPYTVSLVAGIQ
jgi:opacity protein-like surface antigen